MANNVEKASKQKAKKGKSLYLKYYFSLPLGFFHFFVSEALHFVGNFVLKPPTKGDSRMRTLGDLSPLTPPPGHKENLACSNRSWPECVVVMTDLSRW